MNGNAATLPRASASLVGQERPGLPTERAALHKAVALPAGGCADPLIAAPASSPCSTDTPSRAKSGMGGSQLSLELSNNPGLRDAGQDRNFRLTRGVSFKHRLAEALKRRVGPGYELTVKQLAGLVGCSHQQIYNMMSKRVDPAGSQIGQLIDIFGPSFLFDLYGDIGGPMWRRRQARIEAQASAERRAAQQVDLFKAAAE